MAPVAGHRTAVKLSGTPVAITNEACALVSGSIYQVTNTARRILDPDTAIVVKDGGATVNASLYSIDPLFGRITFSGHTVVGAITLDGAYLPTHVAVESRSVSIGCQRKELEDTVFGDNDRTFLLGLKHAEGEIGGLDVLTTDLDAGGDTLVVEQLHSNDTKKLLEVTLNPDTPRYFRCWVRFPELGLEANFDELVKSTIRWKSCSFAIAGQSGEMTTYGFGS